jgi:hypothetical protein
MLFAPESWCHRDALSVRGKGPPVRPVLPSKDGGQRRGAGAGLVVGREVGERPAPAWFVSLQKL